MSNPFGIDGKALMNNLMRAEAKKNGNEFILRMIDIFEKYNLSLVEGSALLAEVVTAMSLNDEEGDDDDC